MNPDQYTLQDPITQHPGPEFKDQADAQGLESRLDPRPDHGEATYRGTGRLRDRKAIITGADSGIGRATAIAYAREGADVLLSYLPREQAAAQEVVGLVQEAGRHAIAMPGDLTDETHCRNLVDTAAAELGGIDILTNIAGRQTSQLSIQNITTDQLIKTFATNVYAMFWLCKAAIPHMPKGATIINTTSAQASEPSPNLLDYAATKAAIVAFTEALAQQLAPQGIRVNAVAPGPIWTALQSGGGQTAENVRHFGADTPYGRPGQPAEVAPAYVFLASPESSYISGETLAVTGGRPL